MVTINLLPWREYVFAYEREFMKKMLLAVLFCSASFVFVLYLYIVKQEAKFNAKVIFLKQELYMLAGKKKAIQPQTNSEERKFFYAGMKTQELFLAFMHAPTHAMCFTQIHRNQHLITFVGRARSAMDLTEFLRHWDAAYLFSAIKIEQLKQQMDNSISFRFHGQEVTNDAL